MQGEYEDAGIKTNDKTGYCRVYLKAFPKEGKLEEYYREWASKYFENYIADDRCFACVLEEADTIIGLITAIVISSIGDDSTHIDTVAIDPDYQHKGYGTQMLNEFIKFSGGRIFSLVTIRDSNGYKLYTKFGFEDEKKSACMIMIPGVTDELMRYRAKLEGNLSEYPMFLRPSWRCFFLSLTLQFSFSIMEIRKNESKQSGEFSYTQTAAKPPMPKSFHLIPKSQKSGCCHIGI